MPDRSFRDEADHLDAALRGERDRVVSLLRSLADRIEAAPVEKVSEGLEWLMSAVEPLVRVVERALGRR